jgi:putative addiction module component (TIGR02574 family)
LPDAGQIQFSIIALYYFCEQYRLIRITDALQNLNPKISLEEKYNDFDELNKKQNKVVILRVINNSYLSPTIEMSKKTTKKLIREIEFLPVEERAVIAESVLKSLNPVDKQIEDQWLAVAERRLQELKSNKVKSIPGKKVFERIQKRFSE